MTSTEYIIEKLESFSNSFKGVRARYENDFVGGTHYIEITPNSFYENDGSFKKWREYLIFDFIKSFPSENISIISEHNIVGLDKCDFEFYQPNISFALPQQIQTPIWRTISIKEDTTFRSIPTHLKETTMEFIKREVTPSNNQLMVA